MAGHDAEAGGVRALLRREVALFADAVRRQPLGIWTRPAPPLPTRADVVRHLAQVMYDAAARLEPQPPRTVPAVPAHALADLVIVCAHDLDQVADHADAGTLGTVLAEVVWHRRQVDGARPGPLAVAAVRDLLGVDVAAVCPLTRG